MFLADSMKDHYNPNLSFYAEKVFKIEKNITFYFQKIDQNMQINDKILFQKNGYVIYKIRND